MPKKVKEVVGPSTFRLFNWSPRYLQVSDISCKLDVHLSELGRPIVRKSSRSCREEDIPG